MTKQTKFILSVLVAAIVLGCLLIPLWSAQYLIGYSISGVTADYYMDFTYASDDNDGSFSKPWSDYESLAAEATDGNTVAWYAGGVLQQEFVYDSTVNSWKTGISLLPEGEKGVDWDVEHLWSVPVQDDRKIIYIASNTKLGMFHNERNERQSGSGNHVTIGADGGGDIRYIIDRDWQRHYLWTWRWAESDPLYPAYDSPFSLDTLTYGTGYSDDSSEVPVVGSIGDSNVASAFNRYDDYHYGQVDEFDDEWHTLTFADDDKTICVAAGVNSAENQASDCGLVLMVVDSNFPCLRFTVSGNGQYYTTPPKTLQVPKIHAQTTYTSDVNVSFVLSNVTTSADCYYKWDSDSYTKYTVPVSVNSLSDTSHTLSYYYDAAKVKTRTVVVNPGFPSDGETHGYASYADDANFTYMKTLCQTNTTTPNYYQYIGKGGAALAYRGDFPEDFDNLGSTGLRTKWSKILHNTVIAKIEGYNDVGYGAPSAARARAMLIDNADSIPDIGLIIGNGDPNPSIRLWRRGYYDVGIYTNMMQSYDILITDFNSIDDADGITAIEDYKIRDSLARVGHQGLQCLGDYTYYGQTNGVSGMWDFARTMTSYVLALNIPTYDTAYYGTSGFDGTAASHYYAPYPEHAISWKDAFQDANYPSDANVGFPNYAHPYEVNEMIVYAETSRPSHPTYGGAVDPIKVGSWMDRIWYADIGLMGAVMQGLSHSIELSPYTTDVNTILTDSYFALCLPDANDDAQLYGMKVSEESDIQPIIVELPYLVNTRFPAVAADAKDYIENTLDVNDVLGAMGIASIIYYDCNYGE